MKNCFKRLSKKKRKLLFDTVLVKVTKHTIERRVLLNLIHDALTPDRVIKIIVDFFLKFGYPFKYEDRKKLDQISEIKRQCGNIKIENPHFLTSIQNRSTIHGVISKQVAGLTPATLGSDLSDTMPSDLYLASINKIIDRRKKQSTFFGPLPPIKLRDNDNDNMWLTWNENNISIPSKLNINNNSRSEILEMLGLGFNLGNKDDHFGLVFEDKKDNKYLFRPGWGDALAYHYWQPSKSRKAKYGYTQDLNDKRKNNQPEAVAENKYFHLDMLSLETFLIEG